MDFFHAQMQAVTEQAKNLSETTTKAMMDGLKTPTKFSMMSFDTASVRLRARSRPRHAALMNAIRGARARTLVASAAPPAAARMMSRILVSLESFGGLMDRQGCTISFR
jgi:hypothetical protein